MFANVRCSPEMFALSVAPILCSKGKWEVWDTGVNVARFSKRVLSADEAAAGRPIAANNCPSDCWSAIRHPHFVQQYETGRPPIGPRRHHWEPMGIRCGSSARISALARPSLQPPTSGHPRGKNRGSEPVLVSRPRSCLRKTPRPKNFGTSEIPSMPRAATEAQD
jgi:hypothetical protein